MTHTINANDLKRAKARERARAYRARKRAQRTPRYAIAYAPTDAEIARIYGSERAS